MERHDLVLASTRVYVLDLYSMRALGLCFMFCFLYRLPSCGLGTLLSSTQVAPLLGLH
ncbi:hypothetical protein BHM03_00014536 [Ensete ventricosum]|uniref:Uncharacterized protein n=1 Tax=Ensete ventricosum TaxID=4639 RepID=A0A445MEC8_ENSVE|nr:hypothetical protein BHM03_00014536 [Ensete ventricosum]